MVFPVLWRVAGSSGIRSGASNDSAVQRVEAAFRTSERRGDLIEVGRGAEVAGIRIAGPQAPPVDEHDGALRSQTPTRRSRRAPGGSRSPDERGRKRAWGPGVAPPLRLRQAGLLAIGTS
jgi:hypothetical protein